MLDSFRTILRLFGTALGRRAPDFLGILGAKEPNGWLTGLTQALICSFGGTVSHRLCYQVDPWPFYLFG